MFKALLHALCWLLASSVTFAADVDALLQQLTLKEKLSLLHGQHDPDIRIGLDSAGYLPGVPRLGIPPIRLVDGPAGIRTLATATALPAPVALAASFDPALAERYGRVLGREGLARNQQILLSPMVNLVRVPQAGRNFETFGEDPLLSSRLVAAEIAGIQQAGMMATVKHFAVNNQESKRLTMDVVVDERTLHELYLPAFEAAVKAGVAAVMCAYNQVNGHYACDNDSLLNQVLRTQWGFQGFVMTDWWANHSLTALSNGLNLEMPGWAHPEYEVGIHFDEPLRIAVESGALAPEAVDVALRPLLVMLNRFGHLDGTAVVAPPREEDNHETALAVALEGAVLLKNDGARLPLTAAELANTVLIGPTALTTLVGGGGSSRVLPSRRDSTRAQLIALGKQQEIRYGADFGEDGNTLPVTALRLQDSTREGLQLMQPNGKRRTVDVIDHTGTRSISGAGLWRWQGDLLPPESGDYLLHIQTDAPMASLYLGDERVLFNDSGVVSDAELLPTSSGLRNSTITLPLQAGKRYSLRVEAWTGDAKPIQVRMSWLSPTDQEAAVKGAIEAARGAGTVLVFAHQEGTETRDRPSLSLPGLQDRVISALAAAYPGKVSVVLNTGGPVTMPWAEQVDAILQMWYPGQAGGEATARLLLGLASPAGKLPVSYPRREQDIPTTSLVQFPGIGNFQQYSEGLFIGYRWYDENMIEPLFPFGHGLGYTQFNYTDLQLRADGKVIHASFTVTNGGARSGSEVPQLYLSHKDSKIKTEVNKLAGFSKLTLAPGESKRVEITVEARSFEFWETSTHQWQALPGAKVLSVGSSSRDLRLRQEFVYSPSTP